MNDEGPKYFYYLGGRKMALTLLAVAVGTAVDLLTERGLSATFATFLAGAVGAFSAANVINTVKTANTVVTTTLDSARMEALEQDIVINHNETQKNFQETASVVQNLAATIENMRKVLQAVVAGKKGA